MRRATLADMDRFHKWRNQPDSIERGSTQRGVEWDEHVAWFTKIVDDPNTILYVIEREDCEIGYIRFDHGETETELSIWIAPMARRCKVGSDYINICCHYALKQWPDTRIVALIHPSNAEVIQFFVSHGFTAEKLTYTRGFDQLQKEQV